MDNKVFAGLVIVGVLLWCWWSSSRKENIAYPFGPIDPMNVNPLMAQAVFGQPDYLFQLSHSPETAPFGAYQALQAAQNIQGVTNAMNIDWQTNQGFNATGNADYNLLLANEPIGAWKNL